ncbi:MAG: hypothetical protein JZU53_12605 [Paludibacter sp.]|nr:hypothetical protein [Paludibacter sp.]
MSEFQLYKRRDFSAYIGDTMQFFKQFWKNYFQNYAVINGVLLLVFVSLYFLLFKDLLSNMYDPNSLSTWMTYNNNSGSFLLSIIVLMIIAIVFSVFTTAFPMVYFNLLNTTGRDAFTASEMLNGIKTYAGRMILFGIISFFVMIPIVFIFFAFGVALSFLIIGIPILFLGLPTVLIWSMQSLYVYLEEETGYFQALSKGWKITFQKYWHLVGATIVVYLCITILASIFSMIPAFMMMGSIITSGGAPKPPTMTPVMMFFYLIGMIVTFIGYNLIYVQQGLIYYSAQENTEHHQAYSDIDNIGKDEE